MAAGPTLGYGSSTEDVCAWLAAINKDLARYADRVTLQGLDGEDVLTADPADLLAVLQVRSLGHKHIIKKHLALARAGAGPAPPSGSPEGGASPARAASPAPSEGCGPAAGGQAGAETAALQVEVDAAQPGSQANRLAQPQASKAATSPPSQCSGDSTPAPAATGETGDAGLFGDSLTSPSRMSLLEQRLEAEEAAGPLMTRGTFSRTLEASLGPKPTSSGVYAEPTTETDGGGGCAETAGSMPGQATADGGVAVDPFLLQTPSETSSWAILRQGYLRKHKTRRAALPQKAKLGFFVLKQDPDTKRAAVEQYQGFLFKASVDLREAVVAPNKKAGRFSVTGLDGTTFDLTAGDGEEALQ